MPDLQDIKKSWNKGKKKNPGPQDFKKQKVKVGRKVSFYPCSFGQVRPPVSDMC